MEEEWEEKLCRLSSDVRREREEKGGVAGGGGTQSQRLSLEIRQQGS